MWAIIKVNKKLNLFENDFKRYFDPNFQIYSPKFKINKSNKIILKFSRFTYFR